MTNKFDPLEVADLTGLTDADWAEINKLKSAHEAGGQKALSAALKALGQDPILYLRIMAAFFPDRVRETIKDEMAESGVTEEDLREMMRKIDRPSQSTH